VRCLLPGLFTVVKDKYPDWPPERKMMAKSDKISVLNVSSILLTLRDLDEGSPTQVLRSYVPRGKAVVRRLKMNCR
jgi:hypothetical protein